MLKKPYVIVDVETTGTSGWYDRIIEIGAIRIENNKIVDEYKSLVNPQTHVSSFIESFTGIKAEELNNAPTFVDIKERIFDLLDGAVFVAHNARFDYGFIKSEFKRIGIPYNAKTLCTVKLSRNLFPQHLRHNLSAIIERFGFACENRHRAYDDAYVLWEFIQMAQSQFPTKKLEKIVDRLLKNSYSGDKKIAAQVENLPESAGVYIFYDSKNVPLYIGKSKNIKERVITHFSSDHESTRQFSMTKDISRIDFIQTAGELGALIQESRLIKELSPIFNRALRQKKEFITLTRHLQPDGFYTFKLGVSEKIDQAYFEELFGVFKNKKSAKEALGELAKRYGLCNKILGIEKTKSSCFEYKLGRCRGACIGKEDVKKYNACFLIAFIENKQFRPWPYDGAIEIVDKNDEDELYETFTVRDWCLVSNVKGRGDAIDINTTVDFDIDTYKIISSHLLHKNPHIKTVK